MNSSLNLKIFPLFQAIRRFSPHFLVAPLYYNDVLDSYALAMSVFSVSLISCAFFEIPMGILSDFIGRKKTILFAGFANFLSFILFILSGIIENFAVYGCFGGALLMGITQALYSGTVDALIYETCKENKLTDNYKNIYAKGCCFGAFSSALSALISSVVAYYYSNLYCFILSATSSFMVLIISLFWVDNNKNKRDVSLFNINKQLKSILKSFKSNKRMSLLCLARILGDNVSYRIDVIYFKTLIPEYLLGTPRMLKKISESISYFFAPYIINRLSPLKTLIVSNGYMIAIRSIAISINNFFSPFIVSVVDLMDGTSSTAFSELLQYEYKDKQRATTSSIVNMISTIWTSVMLVLIGYVIDCTSVRFALFILICYRFIRFFIYYKLYNIRQKRAYKQK